MTRAVVLLLAVAAVGCTDGEVPPILTSDFGTDAGVSLDGGGCATACDCPAGHACLMGQCSAAAPMLFCCTATTCSGTQTCEFPDGTVGQCDRVDAGGVTPVVDGGVPPTQCEMTACSRGMGGNLFCKLACGGLTATCVGSGGIDHCMP
ncbi:MAG: hypothetical protein JWN44_1651 [Myxococcales bacterium]|nr:hypothetical protein [Myxococcales bacterium]